MSSSKRKQCFSCGRSKNLCVCNTASSSAQSDISVTTEPTDITEAFQTDISVIIDSSSEQVSYKAKRLRFSPYYLATFQTPFLDVSRVLEVGLGPNFAHARQKRTYKIY